MKQSCALLPAAKSWILFSRKPLGGPQFPLVCLRLDNTSDISRQALIRVNSISAAESAPVRVNPSTKKIGYGEKNEGIIGVPLFQRLNNRGSLYGRNESNRSGTPGGGARVSVVVSSDFVRAH